eukprot:scaffold82980_cov53-Phaeocystis_antarctica.AAC.1
MRLGVSRAGAAGTLGAVVVRRAERRGLAAAVAAGRALPVCSEGRDAESVVNRMAISSAKKRSPVPELERTSLPPSPCSH